MEPRRLKRLHTRYTRINSYAKLQQLQDSLDGDLLQEGKRLKPKIRKWNSVKINKYIPAEVRQTLFEKYRVQIKPYSDRIKQVKNNIMNEIQSIPLVEYKIVEQVGTEWIEQDYCWTSDYATQGFGAGFYARNSLIPFENKLIAIGLETKIEYTLKTRYRNGTESGVYRLYAKVPVYYGWLIEQHPETQQSLVEIVQGMWKRGVNPRVHYPFLEHGFEEKYNISYT